MTTNHHTPITTGASANAANINAPLSALDSAISDRPTGPASSTDNAIVRWDGTGGDTLQDSGVTVDDDGNMTLGSSTTPVTGAALTVNGDLVVGDGAGSGVATIDDDGVAHVAGTTRVGLTKEYGSISSGVNTTVATVSWNTTSNWVASFIISISVRGSGVLWNGVRLLQVAYSTENITTLGTDTGFGLSATITITNDHTVSPYEFTINVQPNANTTSAYINVVPIGHNPAIEMEIT